MTTHRTYALSYPLAPWLRMMTEQEGKIGLSRISNSSPHCTLPPSCFGALARELTGDLQTLSLAQRQEWAFYIANHQSSETGLFRDPLFTQEELARSRRDEQYMSWQFTFFALGALDALETGALYPLHFVGDFLASNDIEEWLAARRWKNPWFESNNIMFLASFLLREAKRQEPQPYLAAAHAIFDWLDAHQNAETGYWDLNQGASRLNAMAGAFHFYFLYFYLDRSVNHIEQIIDSTLSLQQPDGLFVPEGGGGACLDLDAVDILVKFGMLSDHRQSEVKAALTRAFEAILKNQNVDGGFCEAKRPSLWRKSRKRRVAEFLGLDRLLNRPFVGRPEEFKQYGGWDMLSYRADESNLWATWFRTLALALISVRYPGEFLTNPSWHFRTSPMLGWHDMAWIAKHRSPSNVEAAHA